LYRKLPGRGDAVMELIDALASNQTACSVVELSESEHFRRSWSSVTRAITRMGAAPKGVSATGHALRMESQLRAAASELLEPPQRRNHGLFAVDATPYTRPYAPCLSDRTYVHQSQAVMAGPPVTIGHQYSILVGCPERSDPDEATWVVPQSTRRIASLDTPAEVATQQAMSVFDDPQLPWYGQLTVLMGDSGYGTKSFLGPLANLPNLVRLVRVRSNRVFYRPAPADSRAWYDNDHPFRLGDEATWGEPDEETSLCVIPRVGRQRRTHRIRRWNGLLMRGSRDHKMHKRPFDLLRIDHLDEQGQPGNRKPMWLTLEGQRRDEIATSDALVDYIRRFDQEHMHRFWRQNLLFADFQTPVTRHEETWTNIVMLAYLQLYVARTVAPVIERPWHRHARPDRPAACLSPSMVQRGFSALIRQLGTPARAPKPRNLARGPSPGSKRPPRERHPVIRKTPRHLPRPRAPDSRVA
jgi:hypothetical protein